MVVVVLLGMLTGCSAAPSGGATPMEPAATDAGDFVFRLPRLYVLYVETADGYAEPTLWGMSASQIESWFGLDLSMVKIPQFYMDWMKASDVQHFELVYDGEGIFLFGNGMPMPYLGWNADSLDLVGRLMGPFGVPNSDLIRRLLPLLRHIGLDIVVQMPLAAGAEIIPYRDPAAGLMATTASPEIDDPAAELKLAVSYDDSGVPSLLGMSAAVLQPFMGSTPGQLDPQLIAQMKQAGVSQLSFQIQGDGVFVRVNNEPLPNVAWSEEHLANALDLYQQMNETSWVPNADFVSMVRELVFQIGRADVRLDVNFE
jgi:hypothetical protein